MLLRRTFLWMVSRVVVQIGGQMVQKSIKKSVKKYVEFLMISSWILGRPGGSPGRERTLERTGL